MICDYLFWDLLMLVSSNEFTMSVLSSPQTQLHPNVWIYFQAL